MDLPIETSDKIFESKLILSFKDPNLEEKFNKKLSESATSLTTNLMNMSYFYLTFIFLFVVLFLHLEEVPRIILILKIVLKYILFNFVMGTINRFVYFTKFQISSTKNDTSKDFQHFLILYVFLNTHIGVYEIINGLYKPNVEIISFLYFIEAIVKFLICKIVFKKFMKSVFMISLNYIFELVFLLNTHVYKPAVYYLLIDLVFNLITLILIYFSEFCIRTLFYNNYNRVEKEKKYFLKSFAFLNISYFKIKNNQIKKQIKLDELDNSKKFKIEDLEKIFNDLITIDHLHSDIEKYIVDSVKNQNFNFSKLKEIITSLVKKDNTFFIKDNFLKVGITRVIYPNTEARYFQVFLNFHFNKNQTDYKIEGFFLDVTQLYFKRQIQEGSLVLSKYLHDIKSPLYLLEVLIKKYKSENKQLGNKVLQMVDSIYKKGIEETDNEGLINEVTKRAHRMTLHSTYLKNISTNVFDIIGCINEFTKKQNKIISKTDDSNFTLYKLKSIIILCIDFCKIYLKYNNKNKDIKFLFDFCDEVFEHIYTKNRLTIKQILMNLLSNSLKFTHKGEIKISTKINQETNSILISIADTGCGIEEDNLQKLGKPFAVTTDLKGGSGLGINIVHDLLSSIDSKLEIKSKKGEGSTFSFNIYENNFLIDKNMMEKSFLSSEDQESKISDSNDILTPKNLMSISKINNNLINSKCNKNNDNGSSMSGKSRIKFNSNRSSDCDTLVFDKSFKLNRELINNCFPNKFYQNDDSSNNIYLNGAIENKIETSKTIINSPIKLSDSNEGKVFVKALRKKSSCEFILSKFAINNKSIKSNNLRLLIIDDEFVFQNSFKKLMNNISCEFTLDFHIEYTYNALEGLDSIYSNYLNGYSYDIVFIDENMPFIKGSTFCKFYREHLQNCGLYSTIFVSISGEALLFKTDPNYNGLFDYYLPKPFNSLELKAILKTIIESIELSCV